MYFFMFVRRRLNAAAGLYYNRPQAPSSRDGRVRFPVYDFAPSTFLVMLLLWNNPFEAGTCSKFEAPLEASKFGLELESAHPPHPN